MHDPTRAPEPDELTGVNAEIAWLREQHQRWAEERDALVQEVRALRARVPGLPDGKMLAIEWRSERELLLETINNHYTWYKNYEKEQQHLRNTIEQLEQGRWVIHLFKRLGLLKPSW